MEASLSGLKEPHFLSHQTWNRWLGGLALIGLGWLNLIWPLPTLILLISLVMLGCFLIRPSFALIITIFLMGFQSISLTYLFPKFSLGASIFYFMAFVGLLCWCVARLAGVTPPYQSTTLDLPLAVLCVTGVIALLWTPYLFDGFKIVFATILCYPVYFLISALNTTPRDLKRLFWLFFWLGNLTIITTVASFFFGITGSSAIHHLTDTLTLTTMVTKFTGTRESVGGIIGGPKAIATLIDFSIFCGLTLLCTRDSRRVKVFVYLSVLGMLFIHFLTISRIETIGLLLGWITFAYLNPQWEHKKIRAYLIMVASILAVLLTLLVMLASFYSAKYLIARTLIKEQTVGYRFSGSRNRLDHYLYSLNALWETGGLGAGAGGIMRGMDPSAWMDSASLYMSFVTDHGYGILSFMLMLWIMVNVIAELHRALKRCPDPQYKIFIIGICSALVAFFNPIGDQFFYIYNMWVLLGFTAVAVKGLRCLIKASP
jgi:hypothetical protein